MEGDLAHIGAGLAAIGSGAAAIGVGNVAGNFLAGALRNPSAAASQTAVRFSKTRRTLSSNVPSTISIVSGTNGIWPER